MESAADLSVLEQLGEIVSNLTTSGDPSLSNDLMKKLKAICKKSDVYVKHVYHLVLTQLKKNHAEIRLSSFQIIKELFLRSHTFREMLLIDFQIFLELTVETDYKQPLPPPKSAAKVLKEKAIEAIDSWHRKFGPHYKKLDLGYNYLKRVKNVEFHSHTARTQAERRQYEERQRRKRNAINGQIIRVENEMADMMSEMELCATEIENCFKLLLPHPDEYEIHDGDKSASSSELEQMPNHEGVTKAQDTSEVTEDVGEKQVTDDQMDNQITDVDCKKVKDEGNVQLLSNHGLATRSYQLTIKLDKSGPEIKETDDNSIVLKTVCEFYKELTHKHLPMINKWLSVLSKGEGMQLKIQQLIDLKRTLEASKSKFLELKITPLVDNVESISLREKANNSSDEDDDTEDFEDVPEKEGVQLVIPSSDKEGYGLKPMSTTQQSSTESSCKVPNEGCSFLKQFGADPRELGDPTSRATALSHVKDQLSNADSYSIPNENTKSLTDEKRQKLLKQAPVVPFDMDLYFWGDPNAEVHKMVKTYLDNNWASKEHEGEYLIGDENAARPTRMVTFSGSFQPVKWSCRAPLPSGKLCPRRDRVKCPLHGKIIARDETGTPVKSAGVEGTSTSTGTSDKQNEDSSATDWKEIQLEVEAATGLDLGGKRKRKCKSSSKASANKELKSPGLTDLKKQKNTARNRLGKIVLDKKAMRRVADEMDNIATKRYQEKFANQFNYSLKQ